MEIGDYFWEERYKRVLRFRRVDTEEWAQQYARHIYLFEWILDADILPSPLNTRFADLYFTEADVDFYLEPINAMEVLARVSV